MSIPARCACGQRYDEPIDAAIHWRDSGHTTWSVPSEWMKGRAFSPERFWREILAEHLRYYAVVVVVHATDEDAAQREVGERALYVSDPWEVEIEDAESGELDLDADSVLEQR